MIGASDGWGWMVEKRMMLMATYGWDEKKIMWGITGAKTWVAYGWAIDNQNTVWGTGRVKKSEGYIAQELKRVRQKNGTKRRANIR